MTCTEWVKRRPCGEAATMRIAWSAMIQEGHEVHTIRCYCKTHGERVEERFQKSKQPYTKERL